MAYDASDLISSIKDDLKDQSFNETRLLRYLNQGQRKIFNTHLFDFCRTAVSGTLAAGEYGFEQQPDRQITIGGALTDPADPDKTFVMNSLNRIDSEDFWVRYPNPGSNDPGLPCTWTEYGNAIYFDRPLDKVYNFVQRYWVAPSELTIVTPTNIPLVPETFRELLEEYAKFKAEKYRGNHDIAATHLQAFEDGLEDMNIRLNGAAKLVVGRKRRVRRVSRV